MVLWHQIHGPKSRIDGICPVIKPFGIAQERLRIDFRVEGQGADQLGFFSMMILVVVLARLSQSEENVLVEALVTQPAVKRFDESVLHRFAGLDVVPLQSPCGPTQHCAAGELGPVVATTIRGSARSAVSRSSSRTTRTPPSEVSTTVARHSRLESSTTHRMRKRRPSLSASANKSSDHRWLIASGSVIGALVPSARLRPPRRPTINFSSRYSR